MIGEMEEHRWRLIAASTSNAEGNDVPDPDAPLGQITLERRAYFAFRAEAEAWVAEQEAEAFACDGIANCVTTRYYGPTDAPGNCWHVSVKQRLIVS